MTKSMAKRLPRPFRAGLRKSLPENYFRIRDFEYVQPLYDLAFLLEVDALSKGAEIPQYRTFSLWRAAYSLDGYGTTVDRWIDGCAKDADLDYVPSARIREYLKKGTFHGYTPRTSRIPERTVSPYPAPAFRAGLGTQQDCTDRVVSIARRRVVQSGCHKSNPQP